MVASSERSGTNGMETIDRCPVGTDSRPLTAPQASTQGRTPPDRRSPMLGRNPVDSLDGISVVRTASPIRQPQHLLAALARLGRKRCAAGSVARLSCPTG